MKRIGVLSTFLLFVFLGATALAYRQQDQQEEKKQEKQDKQEEKAKAKKQQQKPEPQRAQEQQQPAQQQPQKPQRAQEREQPAQQEPQKSQRAQEQQQPVQQQPQQPQRAQQQPQQPAPTQQQEGRTTQFAQLKSTPEQQRVWQQEQQRTWQQHRARSFESEHRSWRQRGGYSGYRIPDNDFRSYYGRDHWFRVFSLPFLVVSGSPRFQYGSYWFSPVEAYPEYWGDNWYQNDDVYVDYSDDGYYLYNRRFPDRPGIALNIYQQDQYQYPNQRYYRDQVPGGSYTQTCQNIRVSGDTIYATCQMMNSSRWRDTALRDFDRCGGEINNINGELRCIGSSYQQYQYPNQRYYRDQVPQGSYTQSCQNIRVSGDTIYATCQTMNSGWRETALRDFDRCGGEITNINGELHCR